MTCSRSFDRLLQAACLGLVGMLTVAGCGGSTTKKDSGTDAPGSVAVVQLKTDKASVNFGNVVQGQSSTPAQVVTVTNTGGATTVSPSANAPFVIDSTTCGTLAAAATCTISLKFYPSTVGAASGVLTVASGLTVSLSGVGVAPAAFEMTGLKDLGTVVVGATVQDSITVTATSAVSGLSCTTSGADITADPAKACPATLAAGASCTIGFTFKATTAGQKSNSIVCNATGVTRTTPVTALVVTPASLALDPKSVTITSPVGTASSAVSFSLINGGGAESGALTVASTGATAEFTVTNECLVPLKPSSICKIGVVFKPTSAGEKTLTLTVTDAKAPTTPVTATVKGTGTPPGSLTISGTAEFGTVAVGTTSASKILTVTNPGGSDTAVLTVTLSDTTNYVKGADSCSGAALGAGKTCTIAVAFKPASSGSKPASLSVSAPGAAAATAPLTGIGLGKAVLALAPSTLDFGGVVVNAVSGTKTFTITNTGESETGPLEVFKDDSSSSVGGGSQFSYTSTCQASLKPTETCAVVVTFAPLRAGNASSRISVRAVDLSVSSQAGVLLGLGLETADLRISCADGFADTVVSKVSPTVTCTVENEGDTASGALTAAVTGDFAIVTASNNCATADLRKNMTCTLALTFNPTAKGERTGVLTVTSVNSGAANQQLTGTGLGIVEIKEFAWDTTYSGFLELEAGNYDFPQTTFGQSSDPPYLTLAVYVRASVGNLSVTGNLGTPADFYVTGQGAYVPGASGWVSGCETLGTTDPYNVMRPLYQPVCVQVVQFTPKSKGLKAGSITATGASGQTDTGTFQGTGTGPITLNPSPLTFANIAVGDASSEPLTLTVANNGSSSLTGAQFTLAGANASLFAVVSDLLTGQTIPAGGDVELLIRFIPDELGEKTATLTVTGTYGSTTETATVNLVGNGAKAAGITVDPATVTLGPTAINATSAAATITVTNAEGSVATGEIEYEILGSSEFTTVPPTTPPETQGTCGNSDSTPIGAGGNCTIKVWFKPTAGLGVGARSARLTVTAAPGGTKTVTLAGNATPQITISPATIQDLSNVVLNDTESPIKIVTVTNNGDLAANVGVGLVDNINRLRPTDPAQFRIKTNNCATAVPGRGGTCTLDLQMVPTVAGVAYATLEVKDTSTNQQATVDVQGNGQNPAKLELAPGSAVDRDFGEIRLGNTSKEVVYTVTNTGDRASGRLTYGLYTHRANLNDIPVAHPKASDFIMTGTTCPTTEAGLAAGASCNIAVAFHPTGGDSPTTSVDVDLLVTATPGTETTGLKIPTLSLPRLTGNATASATTDAYLVELSTMSSPYTFPALGTATSLTITLRLTAGSNAVGTVGAFTFSDFGGQGAVGGQSEFAQSPAHACGSLGANAGCDVPVVWTPSLATAGTRVIEVENAASGTRAVLFATVPRAAQLVATPVAGLDFDDVRFNTDSPILSLTVKNTGESVTKGNLVVTKQAGAPADLVVLAGGCQGQPLQPNATCTVSVRIHANSTGSNTYTVTVSDAGDLAVNTGGMPVTWTGKALPLLTPSESSHDFAIVAVGVESTAVTLTLSNQANAEITGPLSISVDDTDFSVEAGTAPGTCGAAVEGLDASEQCTLTVSFLPGVLLPASKDGKITVTSTSGATAEVILTGVAEAALRVTILAVTGGTSVLTPAPSVTFNSTSILSAVDTHPRVVVTFQNATGAPTTGLLRAVLGGTDMGQFRNITDTCTGERLGSGITCTVTLRFDPTTIGSKVGTLTLSGMPGDSAAVALAGTATQ